MSHPDYLILIKSLSPDDGGGYLATVPDLPGCMSDGETREAAARNVGDAIEAWIEEATALNRLIPKPSRHSFVAQGLSNQQFSTEIQAEFYINKIHDVSTINMHLKIETRDSRLKNLQRINRLRSTSLESLANDMSRKPHFPSNERLQ